MTQVGRGYCGVVLWHPKTGHNMGGVLRAAQCFGAAFVAFDSPRDSVKIGASASTNTLRTQRHIPCFDGPWGRHIPYDCVPVAVEMLDGACCLSRYAHPERAVYIFGPEDGGLPESVWSKCRDVVRVPSVWCLNLAACVNVVLYDRMAKRGCEG